VTNPTARKFGFPDTLVAETAHWLVLVRPQQPTFGALVLVCKEDAKAFSGLSPGAFSDLKTAVDGIEALLRHTVAYERINYLMLMMVDPDVHFHVLPRYDSAREFAGGSHSDRFWPKPVDLTQPVETEAKLVEAVRDALRAAWRKD
jgi:diadenosine tetraphosphate (Ap4A) HIT family hydrolase